MDSQIKSKMIDTMNNVNSKIQIQEQILRDMEQEAFYSESYAYTPEAQLHSQKIVDGLNEQREKIRKLKELI